MITLFAFLLYLVAGLPLLRLIQLKEYFLPSFWAHFDYPSSWRLFLRREEIALGGLWLIVLLLNFLGFPLAITSSLWFPPLLVVLGVLILKRQPLLRQLHWTPKFILINLILLAALIRLVGLSDSSLIVIILLGTRFGQLPLILGATWVANAATNFYARRLYRQAHHKIVEAKKTGLRVIGVTGSYGKSATKELLAQLLKTKFRVVQSPLRLNAEIGLSQFILNIDLSDLEFLVLELGTRGLGELGTLVGIFEPEIVFLTGLAPQHAGTLGSFANIIHEKLTIFRGVTPGGIAFVNGADPLITKFSHRINVVRLYQYNGAGSFRAENIRCTFGGSSFVFVHPHGRTEFQTNLIAPHQIENLVGVLAGCTTLGIKPETLRRELQHLTLLPHSYSLKQKADPLIIDDSYNANIVGVRRGAEHFCSLPLGRKVIIFAGVLELGLEAPRYYRELIEAFRGADDLLLTSPDFAGVFREALGARCQIMKNRDDFERFWLALPKTNTGVLVLGRVPTWMWEIVKS